MLTRKEECFFKVFIAILLLDAFSQKSANPLQ